VRADAGGGAGACLGALADEGVGGEQPGALGHLQREAVGTWWWWWWWKLCANPKHRVVAAVAWSSHWHYAYGAAVGQARAATKEGGEKRVGLTGGGGGRDAEGQSLLRRDAARAGDSTSRGRGRGTCCSS
jgi:hypothetical protein